jgi:hypothetical protein
MDSACSTNGEKWNLYRLLVRKTEGKRPLDRQRCRSMNNIKVDNYWVSGFFPSSRHPIILSVARC